MVGDYLAMRAGQQVQGQPFGWYRTGERGIATLAHLFRIGPDGAEALARCGRDAGEAVWRREDAPPHCQRCSAIASGQPLSIGTIGDLDAELRGGTF